MEIDSKLTFFGQFSKNRLTFKPGLSPVLVANSSLSWKKCMIFIYLFILN